MLLCYLILLLIAFFVLLVEHRAEAVLWLVMAVFLLVNVGLVVARQENLCRKVLQSSDLSRCEISLRLINRLITKVTEHSRLTHLTKRQENN